MSVCIHCGSPMFWPVGVVGRQTVWYPEIAIRTMEPNPDAVKRGSLDSQPTGRQRGDLADERGRQQ